MVNKAYKFRIYPNEIQKEYFSKCFGCVRFIYNKMLEDKIKHYKETKQKLNNTPAQYKQEFKWLKEVDSYALCNAQMNLQTAYNNFFTKPKNGFPKFKSKKNDKDSYTTNNVGGIISFSEDKKYIKLCKVKHLRIKCHRQIPENQKIKSVTISKTPSGKYYASILVEYEQNIPDMVLNKNKALGLDYSSHNFYTDSQGMDANYPKFYRNAEEKLAKEQRRLSHMVKGSNNYKKQKIVIAKCHEKIANQRKDWIHKLSTELANEWDYICVEDINLRGIAGTLKLGKSTNDNSFGMFRSYLKYKMADRGKKFIVIDKWFPSSKMCHYCGQINKDLKLSDREWDCSCGEHLLRDYNAALNIRDAGLKLV